MKKLVLGISTALLTVIMCMAFAGCAGKVKGKTYVYEKYEITYADDVNEVLKGVCDTAVATFATGLKGSEIQFKDDGTVVMAEISYKYEQDGKTVTVKNGDVKLGEYQVSGKKLETTLSSEKVGNISGLKSLKIIYKQK